MNIFNVLIISLLTSASLFSQDSLNTNLLYNWQDSTLTGSFAFDNVYNEVWGYQQGGQEYAIIGSTDGTHFFDITDPGNIQQVAFVAGADQGGNIIHRDYHDYNGLLYAISDEGNSTLQIMDLTALPASVPVLYDSDDLFNNVHNIFIDSASGLLYACSVLKLSPIRSNSMEVYSLANPLSPALVYTLTNPTIGHVHDAYVFDNKAYLNAGFDGLYIYDFTDPSSPVLDGVLTIYPFQGYNHSGWLMDDGKHYVFIDETVETILKIVNIEDLDNLQVVSTFGTGTAHSSPHNVIVNNCLAYVSYYYDGLRVYNISDPANPVEVAYYDTYSDTLGASAYEGVWGVYPYFNNDKVAVSDMQTGLYIFDIDIPATRPVADFTVQGNSSSFNFTDQSTGSIDHWAWNFGDGSAESNMQNATHDYSSSGSYEACLRVSNMAGCSIQCDTIQYNVTGIDKVTDNGIIKVYPSVVTDVVHISMDLHFQDEVTITLYDEKGAIIQQVDRSVGGQHNLIELHLNEEIASGAMFLHISSEKIQKGFKLFKSF